MVKVRKASRTLAFLTLVPAAGSAAVPPPPAAGAEPARVQAVLEHGEGWRRVCGSDGKRICCGAVVSLRGEREPGEDAAGPLRSLLVSAGSVASSPHDRMTASGGVKQHRVVERAAAAAASGSAHCKDRRRGRGAECLVGDVGEEVEGERNGGRGDENAGMQEGRQRTPPICRAWWKAMVDAKPCACSREAGGQEGRDGVAGTKQSALGVCGRRHFFVDSCERNKWEERARTRAGPAQPRVIAI